MKLRGDIYTDTLNGLTVAFRLAVSDDDEESRLAHGRYLSRNGGKEVKTESAGLGADETRVTDEGMRALSDFLCLQSKFKKSEA